MLTLNFNLVLTIVNVLIMYFLIKKFLLKPVQKILDQRETEIEQLFVAAKEMQENANQLKNQYEQSIEKLESLKNKELETSRINASKEYDYIVSSAKTQASEIIKNAKISSNMEQGKKMEEAKSEIARLVFMATEKMMALKQGEASDIELYNQFIEKAGVHGEK